MKIRRAIGVVVLLPLGGLLILAGVTFSLPGDRGARPNANYTAAIATMHSIVTAQQRCREDTGRFGDFAALVAGSYLPPAFGERDDLGNPFRSGYRFCLELGAEEGRRFRVSAWPVDPSGPDSQKLFVDESGRLLGTGTAAGDERWQEVR